MGESGPASTLDDPRPKFSQASHQPRRFGSAKPGHGPGLEKRKFGTPGRVPGSRPGLLRFEIKSMLRPVRARKVRSGAWLSRGSPQKC